MKRAQVAKHKAQRKGMRTAGRGLRIGSGFQRPAAGSGRPDAAPIEINYVLGIQKIKVLQALILFDR